MSLIHPTRTYYKRKIINAIMLTLCGLASLVAVVPLLWILIYVAQEGGRFLSVDFFTQLPTPVGVPGGGVLNAIVGSAIVVGIDTGIAVPISITAALDNAEYPTTVLGIAVRFVTDVLSGIPSIVM